MIPGRYTRSAYIDLCNRLGVMAVVDTHMNTDHLHNHIVINAYLPGGERKFVVEKETIMRIRELSDQLQQEYGIPLHFDNPRRQLYFSKGHDTYGEWKARGQGLSWKETMKDEIAAAKSVSDSREDFIAIMEDYGYTIARQETDSITWWNKEHTRKIRDHTLGEAYELGALFPNIAHMPEYAIQQDASPGKKHPKFLSVARYDWNGRRRSDLELLIRKAIALIQHAGQSYHPHDTSARPVTYKLEIMEQALETVQHMELESKEDLKSRMNTVGAKLSHVKSSLKSMEGKKQFYDRISPLIASMELTGHTLTSVRYWPDGKMPDLLLENYSAADTGREKASLFPMSGSQKRELYLKLRAHPEVTLAGKGFSEVSAMDAEEIFAYFKSRQAERPACLKDSVQVTMESVYQKRNARIRATLCKPIQKYQRKHLEELLRSHGLSADMDALTQFDAIDIESCLGNNPFAEPPISQEKQQLLSQRLQAASLSTSREIKYILPGEYDAIMDYLGGARRAKPAILKSSPQIDEMTAQKLQCFMKAKGISCSIPVTSLCKSDYNKMYGFVLGQGQIPECAATSSPTQDKTADFHRSISVDGITDKKRLLLTQYRNQGNELLKLGIDPSDLGTIKAEIAAFRDDYAETENRYNALCKEYKALLQLNQQISYTETPSFLYGPLFHSRVHEAPEVIEREERDLKPEQDKPTPARKQPLDLSPDL